MICEIWGSHGIYYEDIATVTLLNLIQMCQHFRQTCSRFFWNVGTTSQRAAFFTVMSGNYSWQKKLTTVCSHKCLVRDKAWTDHHTLQRGNGIYLPFSFIFQIIILQSYVKICICISNELPENHNTRNIFQSKHCKSHLGF
jgi:hypothetical protein